MKTLLVLSLLLLVSCSEKTHRTIKNYQSNFLGGLNRVCSVYAEDGMPIRKFNGKYDVTISNRQTTFDIDGKRVIIVGGLVICEEL